MDKDANIFETASKELGKKSLIAKKNKQPAQKPAKENVKSHQDPEIATMLAQLHFMKTDLKAKFEEICRKTGMTMEQLEKWLQNPKNLSPSEASKLKLDQEAFVDVIWKTIGSNLKPKKLSAATTMRTNPANERKAKTLGARKHWMPIP